MRFVVLFIALLLLITPCHAATHLTANDFADPHPVIHPKKDYYNEGDEISLNYTIAPKIDDYAVKLDGRYYDLHTSLVNPKFEVVVAYKKGGVLYLNEKHIEVSEWEKGLNYIKVKLKGEIPAIESRLDEIPIFWVNVSDASDDALPSVKVKVINPKLFLESINSLKSKLKDLELKTSDLENIGADTVEINELLKMAKENLENAENYYNKNRYLDSDEKLRKVEESLSKAEKEIGKTGAEFLYSKANKKLDEAKLSIVQFEYLIQQAKNKGIVVTLYEFNLTKIKSDYNTQLDKLEKVRGYINDGKYDVAKKRAEEVIDNVEKMKANIETNIAQLQNSLGGKATPTPKKTENSFDISTITKKLDVKLVAIIAAIIVVGLIVYMGRGRIGRKRKWDELK